MRFERRDKLSPMKESHVLQYNSVQLDDHLAFVKEPVSLLSREVRRLHSGAVPVIKVQLGHCSIKKAD